MPIVYLDVCSLNRPFDDQRQDRIRLESEAVLIVLGHVERGDWAWIGSEAIDLEIAQNTDSERLERLQLLTATAGGHVAVSSTVAERATALEALGVHPFDALHVACAEAGSADVLLTVDDQLLRTARRLAEHLFVKVANPVTWLEERFRA